MDAEAWLATQHDIVSAGAWRPRAVHAGIPVTLGEYARSALERRNLGPGTASLYQRLLSRQILRAFGDELVADISSSQVSRRYLSMTHTPTQRANAYALLKSILKDAVEDGLIQSTPARIGGRSPKAAREMEVLTVQQLHRYLAAVSVRHRVPLLLIGWCGLRSGEVRGLRVMDLDLGALMPAQRYETLAQACERTGISRNTLRRRIASGELPAFMTGRRIPSLRPEDSTDSCGRVAADRLRSEGRTSDGHQQEEGQAEFRRDLAAAQRALPCPLPRAGRRALHRAGDVSLSVRRGDLAQRSAAHGPLRGLEAPGVDCRRSGNHRGVRATPVG